MKTHRWLLALAVLLLAGMIAAPARAANALDDCLTKFLQCYTVKPGDSLWLIAEKHGSNNWQAIVTANRLPSTQIEVDQILGIPNTWPQSIKLFEGESEKKLLDSPVHGPFGFVQSPNGVSFEIEKFEVIQFNNPDPSDYFQSSPDIHISPHACAGLYELQIFFCDKMWLAHTTTFAGKYGSVRVEISMPSHTYTAYDLPGPDDAFQFATTSFFDSQTNRLMSWDLFIQYDETNGPGKGMITVEVLRGVVVQLKPAPWPTMIPSSKQAIEYEAQGPSGWRFLSVTSKP